MAELPSVFRSAIAKAGLQLTVNRPPLSQAVYVDREMWEKIVLNLLSNAFKLTFKGEIEVLLEELHDRVELRVRDTGVGIRSEEVPHLFERFHRVKGAQGSTHEGTDIGPALVQELIKLHGGVVTAESDYGHGTAFIVSIPKGKRIYPRIVSAAARAADNGRIFAPSLVELIIHLVPE
jgi:signal transduction histidine kinase